MPLFIVAGLCDRMWLSDDFKDAHKKEKQKVTVYTIWTRDFREIHLGALKPLFTVN